MADGQLIFDTKIDSKGFEKGVAGLSTLGKKSFDIFKTGTKAMGLALTGAGAAVIKMGSDFESGMSRVQALTGATETEFKRLEETAMKLGRDTVFSATEASEAMSYLGMAGFKTNDIISAMPGLLNMAAAGQTDLATTADITSNILSGFGIEAEKTGHVADVLTAAFTGSNTSLESLGETMKYVAPVAKSAGFSLEEMAAAAGFLGDAGIQGGQAGTSLRKIILRLADPPKQAAEALSELGIETVDASGKLKSMADISDEFTEATKDMSEAERLSLASRIAGTEASAAFLAIVDRGGDALREFTSELENSGGVAERVANTQIDNLQGQMKLLSSVTETLGITIYKELQEPLKEAAKEAGIAVGQLVDAFNEAGFEGLAMELGNVLVDGLMSVAEVVPRFIELGKNIITSFSSSIKANKSKVGQAMSDVIKGLVDIVFTLYPEMMSAGLEIIAEISNGLVQGMPEMITTMQEGILNLANSIKENLPIILENGIQIILAIINGIAEMLPELMTIGIEIIIKLADLFIENMDKFLEAGLNIIKALVQGLMDNLPTLIENVPRIINDFTAKLTSLLPQILAAGIEIIIMLAKGLIQAIPTLIANIPAIILAIVNAFMLHDWLGLGKNLIANIGSGISSMVGNLGQIARNVATKGIEVIKNIFRQGPQVGRTLIQNLVSGIRGMASSVPQALGNIARSGMQALRSAFSSIGTIGYNLVVGLWNGIGSMTRWILGKIADFGRSITNKLKSIFDIRSPSRVWKDMIGKNLVLGIGVGVDDETPGLVKDLEKMSDEMNAAVDVQAHEFRTSIPPNESLEIKRHKNKQEKEDDSDIIITGNEFIVRDDDDIEKIARELKRLSKRNKRGGLGYAL